MKYPWLEFPSKFLDRLKQIIPQSQYQVVLNALCEKRPTTLRANTLKIGATDLKNEFEKLNIPIIHVPWWENAFIVGNVIPNSFRDPHETLKQVQGDRFHLTDLDLYKQGFFYIQSLSSMVPPLILNPQKDETILDMCAAPGSKTTQMAALMENTGEIVANDNSRIRVFKLQANLKIQGVTNTKVEISAGQSLWEKYPQYFDKTLVDVPCSMEGRFLSSDPKTFQFWSTKKIKEFYRIQRFLLRSAISCTKVGGTVVFSTCTMAPEENEGIIDWILNKEKDTVIVEDVQIPQLELSNSQTQWNGKVYNSQVTKTKRILPGTIMEGFFVAKLKKIKSNVISF
jgi:NOL1/NOP2/sun family putative RNA methylase